VPGHAPRARRTPAARRQRARRRRPRRLAAPCRQRALFALTPTGLLAARDARDGVRDRGAPRAGHGGDDLRARRSSALLARVRSTGVLDRFRVESLSTTDAAGSSLDDHRALRRRSAGFRIRRPFAPTRSPHSMQPVGTVRLSELEAAADLEIGDYATFVEALTERRAAFKVLGATATDHAATSADTTRLADREAATLFAAALAGTVSDDDARCFEAHMLNEFARMSRDDGLVMQLQSRQSSRSQRTTRGAVRARHRRRYPGRDDWTRGLRPLLEAVRQRPGFGRHSLHPRREHVRPRARAARGHYPAVLLGCPGGSTTVRGHRPVSRPGRRDGRRLQPRRVRRRRPRIDGAPGAARPVAPSHLRLARRESRGRLPGRGGGQPDCVGARLRPRPPHLSHLNAAERVEPAVDGDDDSGDERRGGRCTTRSPCPRLLRLAEAARRGRRR